MGKYFEYVEFLHRQLLPTIRSAHRTDVDDRQWRQLIVVAIVFCLNYIEEGKFAKALDMLRRVEQFLIDDVDIDRLVARELRALLDDAFGFYYFRRGK
jgi:hypothetical protein